MLLGKTDHQQQQKRFAARKSIRIVTIAFLIMAILPFVVYSLFPLGVFTGKSAFESDIQEPVARVVTPAGVGTAFLINPTTLLTARHVVENNKVGDQVDLFFEHSPKQLQTKATIKYIAPATISAAPDGSVPLEYFLTDVAVLEVSEISDIEPLLLGESDAVSNLDEVILIGYPGGDYSISKGNINSDSYQGLNLFKLDATSNPGNSGGPCILKEDNSVIGILVGSNATDLEGENVALKINDVKKILVAAGVVM